MDQNLMRPYQAKTDGELFLNFERNERDIKSLTDQNAAIQAEMQLRGQTPGTLAYQSGEVSNRTPEVIGDLYADRSRRYAIQMTLIGLAVFVALAVTLALFMRN